MGRNNFVVDDSAGLPLTFSLQRETGVGLDKANWTIVLADTKGQQLGSAKYATAIPVQSRPATLEAALVSAATQAMPQMQVWLAAPRKEPN